MCSSGFIGRVADPLNISQGTGYDLAKPFGGFQTKIDPAGLFTPKPVEVQQAPTTGPANPTPTVTPRVSQSRYSGLQISQ